jgi:hypothetical protein
MIATIESIDFRSWLFRLIGTKKHKHRSATRMGKWSVTFMVLPLALLTLPLYGQQTASGDSAGTVVPVNQVAGVTNPRTAALDSGGVAAPSSSPGGADPQQTAKQQTPQPANRQSPAAPSDRALTGNLLNRLAQFYSQDWAGTNPAGPSVTKRGLPAALNSPPFPFSDWTYGGAPDIGAPDGNTYPLMSALNLESSRTKSTAGLPPVSISARRRKTTFRSHTTFFRTRSNSIRQSYTSNASPTP